MKARCIAVYTRGRMRGKRCKLDAAVEGYCRTHAHWYTAEIARKQGLRTVAKPGDPDFREVTR